MGKIKTSQKLKKSILKAQKPDNKSKNMKKSNSSNRVLKKEHMNKEYDPIKDLLDKKKLGSAIIECLMENDTEGALEIIEGYLYAVDRTQVLKDAKIARSTAYNVFKRRNPTIKTLAKILYASSHN